MTIGEALHWTAWLWATSDGDRLAVAAMVAWALFELHRLRTAVETQSRQFHEVLEARDELREARDGDDD